MSTLTSRQQAALTGLLFILLLLLVPRAGYDYDVDFWARWSAYIFQHGLGNAYQLAENTYNPLYQYILWLYGHLMGSVDKINHYRHWVKAFTLVFDFAGAFWAASLVPERSRRFGLALLLLLNLGYLYNTLIWIQVDSIYTFFAFGAVVLAARQRTVASMLCYVLAIAAKTQAIVFLPPLLLLWAPQWWHRPWQLGKGVLAGAALATAILAPFIWWSWESYLPRIIQNNLEVSGIFPRLSMNAFNLWYLITDYDQPSQVSDALPFAGLTYHKWGLLLFGGVSALALLPLLVAAWHTLRGRLVVASLPLVLLSCGIIPLVSTFFNTQMHERYWHPALLFLAAYSFVRRDYVPLILASCAYFLHLERGLQYLQLLNYSVLVFRPKFIALLFALLIVLVLLKIYQLAPWRTKQPLTQPVAAPLPVPHLAG